MKIGTRQIGPEHPPYIIAEIGVNHDGSVERALELTDAAAGAGADAVKLQLFKADLLMSKASRLAAYQKAAGESDPVEMLRRLELSVEQMAAVVERAHAKGIHAIVTVFSLELVKEAERLAWDAYKTASPDIVHRPLLEALMATGRPLIVSTGASTLEEVGRAVGWLREGAAHGRLAVLQCVSSYPTEQLELGGIRAIGQVFDGPVGYSDHSKNQRSGGWAVAAGACLLEKHLTYDRNAAGPDHAASLVPWMMKRYVDEAKMGVSARGYWQEEPSAPEFLEAMVHEQDAAKKAALDIAYLARGRVVKQVLPIEQDVRSVSRQSIVAARDLAAGRRVAREDVTFKRPGTGIEPHRLEEVIGRVLSRGVGTDRPLMEADLA